MSELSKQIRLRSTAKEKQHLDTAAADAGYDNLSDYLRHVLFDKNVLIVGDGEHSSFTLVPAWSSVEEERTAAITNVEGILTLIEELKARTSDATPQAAPPAAAPEAPPAGVEEQPVPAASAPAAAPGLDLPLSPLTAVPDQPTSPAITGPTPLPDESYDVFLARRTTEIQLTSGATSVRAGFEADAEWRAHFGGDPAPQPEPAPGVPAADHGFCGQCGAALAGTPFCGKCGAPTGVIA